MTGILVVAGGFSVGLGFVPVLPSDIFAGGQGQLVAEMRLTRFLIAACVGASLAAAGMVMQVILRNPLVEPSILGLNSGAALAAAAVLLLSAGAVPQIHLSIAAIFGALSVMGIVLAFGWSPGQRVGVRLILAGIAVSGLCGALLTALTLSSPPNRVPRLLAWLAGDLNGLLWGHAIVMAVLVVALYATLLPVLRWLDALNLDRQSAAGLGIQGRKVIFLPLLIAATAAGVTTSIVGIVAFVGLVAPHMARRIMGPSHARVLPAAMLVGAILVAFADLVGRTMLSPNQIPAGLITALVGAPWFFVLMARHNV